ncbi:PNPOx family protein [Subtercola endophyticus]|uniref:hypothetical protein n=1 Tax=Subtercola endophyticus TaxID=2895559 RepID=UPI001E35422D|nr:hypothetical protein [Subtercola endophyticus]UFS57484.1 hypothetical protein LQ955_10455 [Subtercola endophyticus]
MAAADLDVVTTGSAIILQTQKRDGSWVATPVTPTRSGDVIYVMTDGESGKAKRIRNFPTVKVSAGTNRGKATGPVRLATARRLTGDDHARGASIVRRKHPIVFGAIIRLRFAFSKADQAVFELADFRPEE